MRTGGPEEGVHKGVNTGVDGVNRGVNRGVHMFLSCASAAPALGRCGMHTSPPRRARPFWNRVISNDGFHQGAGEDADECIAGETNTVGGPAVRASLLPRTGLTS